MNAKSLLCGLLLLSFPTLLFAETKLPASRNNEPIKIKSDRLTTDNNRKMATFEGNVAARQGDITIYSDKMVINYADDEGRISTTEVFGNVRKSRESGVHRLSMGYTMPGSRPSHSTATRKFSRTVTPSPGKLLPTILIRIKAK